MPTQPTLPQESFADLAFPDRGIDLARGYGQQLPGTTPAGVNVRTYEALTQRGRGGTRPGLVQFVPQALPLNYASGLRVIQHLNLIVDPQTLALTDTFDDPDPSAVDDPSSPGTSQDWGYVFTGGAYVKGTTRNPGRKVRKGGTGRQPSKNRKQKRIFYRQGNALRTEARTAGQQSLAFTADVVAGNLVLLVLNAGGAASVTAAVTDSQANTYTQAGSYVSAGSGVAQVSLWYTRPGSSGPLTVLWTPSAAASSAALVAEYGNVNAATPFDAPPTALNNGSTSVPATPSVAVNFKHDAFLGVFVKGDRFLTAYAAGAGFTNRLGFSFSTTAEAGTDKRLTAFLDDATDVSAALAETAATTATISGMVGVGLSLEVAS